jgi:Helix-turn-helix domain
MSLSVLAWVLDHSDERLGNRLVLLALAEFAHDDGSKAFPKVETLMTRSRLSERQVRNCLRSLEQSGAIVQTGTTQSGTHVYRVVGPFKGGANIAGLEGSRGAKSDPRIAPDPTTKKDHSSSSNGLLPRSVAGKVVSSLEHEMASAILAAFNDAAGKSFGGQEWRRSIIMRLREHPELEAADHQSIIARQFEHPWWSGDPTPSVIYGNGAVFDRALNGVKGGKPVDKTAPVARYQEYDL